MTCSKQCVKVDHCVVIWFDFFPSRTQHISGTNKALWATLRISYTVRGRASVAPPNDETSSLMSFLVPDLSAQKVHFDQGVGGLTGGGATECGVRRRVTCTECGCSFLRILNAEPVRVAPPSRHRTRLYRSFKDTPLFFMSVIYFFLLFIFFLSFCFLFFFVYLPISTVYTRTCDHFLLSLRVVCHKEQRLSFKLALYKMDLNVAAQKIK